MGLNKGLFKVVIDRENVNLTDNSGRQRHQVSALKTYTQRARG